MRRYVLIILGVAVLAWAVLAIVLGSPSLNIGGSGSEAQAASPRCELGSPERPARLPDTNVDVSPAPESGAANPATQISFLGASPGEIQQVSVSGSASGRHEGRLSAYSQGDGASFLPAEAFEPGEQVTVSATLATSGAPRHVSYRFHVATPYSTAHVPQFPASPATPADSQSFVTMPGVKAPVMSVTTADRDPRAGDIFVTNGPGPGQYGPLIYTPQGGSSGSGSLTGETTAENLQVQSYRRPAGPDVVEGSRALARLRAGRRHRDERPLPGRSPASRAATG